MLVWLHPPDLFTFSKPEEWPKWIRRFEWFRHASGLDEKEEKKQVSTLIYSMGDEAEDILHSFRLTEDELKLYSTLRDKFGSFFVKRRNLIFERCRLNRRRQEEGESAASFINDVHTLAEHCDYGDLQEELIQDRLVEGIRNGKLSERLLLDPDLTLGKAVTIIRESESVHQQQTFLRGEGTELVTIDAVKTSRNLAKKTTGTGLSSVQFRQMTCSRCRRSPIHDANTCPARDAVCRNCGERGHFQRVCRSKRVSAIKEYDQPDNSF